jgi:hypothetical protein
LDDHVRFGIGTPATTELCQDARASLIVQETDRT